MVRLHFFRKSSGRRGGDGLNEGDWEQGVQSEGYDHLFYTRADEGSAGGEGSEGTYLKTTLRKLGTLRGRGFGEGQVWMVGSTVVMLTRTESRGGKQLWGKSNESDLDILDLEWNIS